MYGINFYTSRLFRCMTLIQMTMQYDDYISIYSTPQCNLKLTKTYPCERGIASTICFDGVLPKLTHFKLRNICNIF